MLKTVCEPGPCAGRSCDLLALASRGLAALRRFVSQAMGSRRSITLLSSLAVCLLLSSGAGSRCAFAQLTEASPGDLAKTAFALSRQGKVLSQARDAWSVPSKWSLLSKKSMEQQQLLWSCLSRELETQARFKSALAALKLHHALASCQMGLELQAEAQAYVQEQIEVQEELIQSGGQIDDATALQRALIDLQDQKLQIESQQSKLRDELSLLVGPQWACSYQPTELASPSPELSEPCEVETWAIANRSELRALGYMRNHSEALSDEAIALLDGVPSFPISLKALWGPKDPRRWIVHRPSQDQVTQRQKGLDNYIQLRSDQIRIEAAAAYRAKALAFERWKLAVQKTESLGQRCETLKELSEYKGNLPEQIQANLELFRARALELERLSEWHQADCDLHESIGRAGFWNAEVSPSVPARNSNR